jgi:hypothetical protein
VCRQIETKDLDQVVALLTIGFRDQRKRAFWVRAIEKLSRHETPPDLPRFGYLLASDDAVVGVILLIFTAIPSAAGVSLRGNLSSWYVAAEFRTYAPMLVSRALKHREATYLNLTPAPHTQPILQAQGYKRFCEGRFISAPALARRKPDAEISAFAADTPSPDDLTEYDAKLLRDHAGYDCISFVCRAEGKAYPFVFAPRRKYGFLGVAVLSYCHDVSDFARFAGPIGRHLLRRGYPLVSVDADSRIVGLLGVYDRTRPKYFRGSDRPRLGDAAYTERTMFGS